MPQKRNPQKIENRMKIENDLFEPMALQDRTTDILKLQTYLNKEYRPNYKTTFTI